MRILTNRINAAKALNLQNLQHLEAIPMSDIVPASGSQLARATVSNYGHFFCLFATGKFSTLHSVLGVAADDGVSHLRGKLIDGGTSRPIFNDFIPLDLWLTPGRVRDAQDITGAVSNNLFIPLPFEYLFMANTDIQLDLRNDGDWPNSFTIAFWGVRVSAYQSVAGVPKATPKR